MGRNRVGIGHLAQNTKKIPEIPQKLTWGSTNLYRVPFKVPGTSQGNSHFFTPIGQFLGYFPLSQMTYWRKVPFLTDDPLKQNGWWQIFQSFPTEDYRKPIGSTKAGMEKCKRHRKGSSRPFLTLIRHQSRLPQLKDRSSSDELTWNLSYAWSNFTKTVQKRTSKEENTKTIAPIHSVERICVTVSFVIETWAKKMVK